MLAIFRYSSLGPVWGGVTCDVTGGPQCIGVLYLTQGLTKNKHVYA